MAKITQRQENFCLKFIETGNATEAYKIAYPKSVKWKEGSVTINASQLMAKPNIILRVKALQAEVQERIVCSAVEKQQLLWNIALITGSEQFSDDGIKEIADPNAAVRAVGELNKMQGDLAAIKTDNNTNVTGNVEIVFNGIKA